MSILLGDNFSYSAQKPLDGRLKYDTLADMIAVGDATMYDGCLAYCVATDKTYQWKSTNDEDPTLRKWREFTSGGNIQVEELPEASADELNNIYMYMGDDDSTEGLVHAHFYQCVSDGGSPATYSWKDMGYIKVYVGSSSDFENLSLDEKVSYDEAHFTDDEGSGVDMYSTTETKTNKVWIDGKPIYRKVIPFFRNGSYVSGWTYVAANTYSNSEISSDIETIVKGLGLVVRADGWMDTYASNASGWSFLPSSNRMFIGYAGTISKADVILEYTKTTD